MSSLAVAKYNSVSIFLVLYYFNHKSIRNNNTLYRFSSPPQVWLLYGLWLGWVIINVCIYICCPLHKFIKYVLSLSRIQNFHDIK